MKFALILILTLTFAFLGCSNPKNETAGEAEEQVEVNIDDALAGYEGGTWIESYEDAISFSKDLSRPILVNFTGSDWCGWCVRLSKEVFSQKEFLDYAKTNLILLKLDFPKSIPQTDELKAQNQKLQDKFKIRGYPTILLIDSEGSEISRTGYREGGAASYVEHLKSMLTK